MATSSIARNVIVKEKNAGRKIVLALENASKKSSKDVQLSRKCRQLSPDKIKEIFGEQ